MMKKVCLVAAAAAAVTVSPVAGVKLNRRGEGDAKAEEPAAKEEEKPAASGGLTLPTAAAEPKYKEDGEMEKPLKDMESKDEKKLWFSVLLREYALKPLDQKPEDVAKKNAEIYKKYGDDMIECGFATKNQVDTFKGAGGSSGGFCPC